jgi:4-hydroxyphenylpyruvate dioxygenase-like putative hemolysin
MLAEQLYDYMRERIEWAFTNDTNSNVLESNNVVSSNSGSRCLLAPWAFSQTPIVQAVNKLNTNEKTLVKFIAGLDVEHGDMVNLTLSVWTNFYQAYLVFHRMNSITIPKAQNLIEFALINYKLSAVRLPLVKSKYIMQAIGVHDSKTFSRDWKPRLNVMNSVISEMEHSALEQVLSSIDEKRKKHA